MSSGRGLFRRLASVLLLGWALGFLWFAVMLPQPAGEQRTDAVVVLTGGKGRIDRALLALDKGWADELLVSGVDRHVKPHEFALEYKVAAARMACCISPSHASAYSPITASVAGLMIGSAVPVPS